MKDTNSLGGCYKSVEIGIKSTECWVAIFVDVPYIQRLLLHRKKIWVPFSFS